MASSPTISMAEYSSPPSSPSLALRSTGALPCPKTCLQGTECTPTRHGQAVNEFTERSIDQEQEKPQKLGHGKKSGAEPTALPIKEAQKIVMEKLPRTLQAAGIAFPPASMEAQIASLEGRVQEMETKLNETRRQLKCPEAASQTVQAHIKRLHQYNEIRDVGTGLFGLIAERRGVRVKDVFEEFGVGEDD